MVEIEIGVLRGQCLGRRIGDRKALETEIAAWEAQRTPPVPASNGCSQLSALASNYFEPIQTPSRSHNPCAEVLVADGQAPPTFPQVGWAGPFPSRQPLVQRAP
jgi:hypothetical protein